MRSFVEALFRGEVIACPTETQMGLLADALDDEAIARVGALKHRPASEPIGLIVPSLEVALQLVSELTPLARQLAEQHWPGPLTLVMRARPHVPAGVQKHGTVAIRVPGPSPAYDLVRAFGGPLTATSANISGQPPLATEAELRAAFGEGLAGIVPGSPPGGAPSTIVDVTTERPVLVRAGALALTLATR
jgi:L-threonylcarbamoyladenylate synthase